MVEGLYHQILLPEEPIMAPEPRMLFSWDDVETRPELQRLELALDALPDDALQSIKSWGYAHLPLSGAPQPRIRGRCAEGDGRLERSQRGLAVIGQAERDDRLFGSRAISPCC